MMTLVGLDVGARKSAGRNGVRTVAALLVILALFASLPRTAHAVPVLPGDSKFLSGTSLAARPELAGTIVGDTTLAWTSSANPTVTGTVHTIDRARRISRTELFMRIEWWESSTSLRMRSPMPVSGNLRNEVEIFA